MKITVLGLGYVGLANSLLLARQNTVVGYDIVPEKIAGLKEGRSPIKDREISEFLERDDLDVTWTMDFRKAIVGAELVIIATPTNYDEAVGYFDVSTVEDCLARALAINPEAIYLIKSTIPVGYVKTVRKKLGSKNIIFSPEFLREGKALYDNLHPSRVVIGEDSPRGRELAKLFTDAALDLKVPVVLTGATEAEAIKLFANTYLALRVAYFNELDTYAEGNELDAESIITGIGLDPRIGSHYNNPSFGYGGYCLPKDTRQLLANYKKVPQNLIKAIVQSNQTRKDYVVGRILDRKPRTVGIYRLAMKSDSDNFRKSAVIDVMDRLVEYGVEVVVYEPTISDAYFNGVAVVNDLREFKKKSDVIVANRKDAEIADVAEKVYSRDVFTNN